MSKFRDCIASARDQGVLSPSEADDLIARYEAHRRSAAAEGAPETAAQEALAKEFDALAARQRRLADLAAAKQDEIVADITAYRTPGGKADVYEAVMRKLEHFGFTGYSSIVGRSHAIVSLIHGDMQELLRAFERNFFTGLRHDKPLARDVVREILGEASGRPEAKAFSEAVSKAFEQLRERFNAAGGDIGRIEGGYLPQFHDPLALYKTGFEAWRDDIVPRLALDKMRDPISGGPLTPDRLGESLRAAFDHITSDGWAGRTPTMQRQGKGALASQRADERFFVFKSADDWLAYNEAYGRGDPVLAIFQHINVLSRDVAALEILGPNPAATIEWLKQVVLTEHAKAIGGKESLFNLDGLKTVRGERERGAVAAQRIEDLFQWTRGRATISGQLADFMGNVRNVLTSAQLGSASITAATTDPAIEAMARKALGMSRTALFGDNSKVYLDTVSRYFEQLPVLKSVSLLIDHMTGAPRAQALRSGMIAEDFLHILGDQARYAGDLGGNFWTRWLADRTLTLTGLTPLTEARKSLFQLELQAFAADLSQQAFDALPERLRTKMQGYGIGVVEWDILRAVPQYKSDPAAAGLIRPSDVAAVDRALAERYAEMILGETERAVPSATMRSKAFFLGSGQRGQIGQELLQSFLQYRSFGLSMMTLQLEAVAHEGGFTSLRGAGYAGQLFLMTTIGGALALQLKNVANGRDPQNMKDPKFWLAAMATGGGFGIAGDFMFADYSRFGHTFAETLAGPTGGLVSDLSGFLMGSWQKAAHGDDPQTGKTAVDLAGKYTPFLSSAWMARLAYKRMILDPLQYQLDPKASRRWREQERRAIKDRGQGFYWPPGTPSPVRGPDWSRALP